MVNTIGVLYSKFSDIILQLFVRNRLKVDIWRKPSCCYTYISFEAYLISLTPDVLTHHVWTLNIYPAIFVGHSEKYLFVFNGERKIQSYRFRKAWQFSYLGHTQNVSVNINLILWIFLMWFFGLLEWLVFFIEFQVRWIAHTFLNRLQLGFVLRSCPFFFSLCCSLSLCLI